MLCTAPVERRPCGHCGPCKKVFSGIHPDVAVISGPAQGKPITVDQVRQLRADAYIRPNEGRRKVYVFPDCALLTEQDQNVLLKVVEEGPPYAAFLFCAENAAVVLQTLRSRCVELKLHPAAEGGWRKSASPGRTCPPCWSGAGPCARRRCCCNMDRNRRKAAGKSPQFSRKT